MKRREVKVQVISLHPSLPTFFTTFFPSFPEYKTHTHTRFFFVCSSDTVVDK